MNKINLKTPEEIEIMAEGGAKLGRVKAGLRKKVAEGVRASEIEDLANELIKKEGGESSFKKVPGYSWSTCVNVNSGVVHGIPSSSLVFKKGDLVSVDLGIYFNGFHTDTSFSVAIEPTKEIEQFLKAGRKALDSGIKEAKIGNKIRDISKAIQSSLEADGLTPLRALVGHGIGRNLHEYPPVPCYVTGERSDDLVLKEGLVIAIEVMYTMGKPAIKIEPDGWTISMKDGKISGLFEETVALSTDGPRILTES